ncbi:MAG: 2-hydroxyacid dehydrogenase [Alphaproteobacteria bacterium]|nr:2-hydroxyacid dehydrogenase [Alphaproteobacteria bacterium]
MTSQSSPPRVLVQGTFPDAFIAALAARFDLVRHDPAVPPARAQGWDKSIRGVVSWARLTVTREMMDCLPGLEIVAGFGVGYDRFDLQAAKEKGIVVTNTPDVLNDDVADIAMGLMIAASRRIAALDRFVRAGRWAAGEAPAMARKVTGKRLGIAGLGRIGRAIARRAQAFDMKIAYTGPRAYADVPYAYVSDLVALARESDFLMIACRADPATRHMVNAKVLAALGAKGILVNIARGSVVDEAALVRALKDGTLGGAGLDVFADEPRAPAELFALDNVVLTPHVASSTVETRTAMGDLVIANLESHFAGRGPLTPVVAR